MLNKYSPSLTHCQRKQQTQFHPSQNQKRECSLNSLFNWKWMCVKKELALQFIHSLLLISLSSVKLRFDEMLRTKSREKEKKEKKSVTTNFLSTKHNLSFNLSFLCFLGATCYVKSFAKTAKCVLRKSTYSFGNWSPINDIDFHFASIFATISFDWLID